jgi:hypothetical protein
VDFEEFQPQGDIGFLKLIKRIREEMKPNWILLDARTGISETAGILLSGIAHLHVLLGTPQDQSWQGLNRVLDRLGKYRILINRPQSEVLVVHAMVPAGDAGKSAKDKFNARSEREFTDRYFAEADDENDEATTFWDIHDMESRDAPHVPVPLEYDTRLTSFSDIAEVADILCQGSYELVEERITARFRSEAGI